MILFFSITEGFPNIVEICGQLILEKSSLLKQIPGDCLQQLVGTNSPHEGAMYAGIMSSIATFEDHIAICDTGTETSIHALLSLVFGG